MLALAQTDQAERNLRASQDVERFEKLQELSDAAKRGPFADAGQKAANVVLGSSVVGGAVTGGLLLGPLGAIAGGIGGLFVGGEVGALGVKAYAEHRLRSFLKHVAATPASPPAIVRAPSAPSVAPVAIAPEEIQKALHDRYQKQAEAAVLDTHSDRLHEIEARVTKQLLLERVRTPWSYATPQHCASDTAYDPASATVFTAVGINHTTFMTAFDTAGRVRWSFDGAAAKCGPVVSNGTVYFRTEGALHAVNALGQEKWKVKTVAGSSWEDRPPAVAADGTAYVLDGLDNYGFDQPNMRLRAVRDGIEKWVYDCAADYTGDPQVLCGRDGTVYLTAQLRERERSVGGLLAGDSTEKSYLVALRPDGTLKFKAAVDYWPSYVATSLAEGPDGTVYAAHGEQYLTAFTSDGHERWTYRCADRRIMEHSSAHARLTQAPAFDADGNVYLATNTCADYPEGYLVRLGADGKEQWIRAVEGGISSRPHFGPDGRLYLTTSSGELRTFDTLGNQQDATVVGDVSWSNFAFGSEGELFLNTDRQILEYQPDAARAAKQIYAPEPEPLLKPPAADGKVEDSGEYVVIGGLRLKKRPAEG